MHLWVYSRENLSRRHRRRFAALRHAELKTARAWAIKEDLRRRWSYHRSAAGLRHWKAWYLWAMHSRLAPVMAVGRMLQHRLRGILAYFRHRFTNAGSENLNFRIQAVRTAARGYRNRGTSSPPSSSIAVASTSIPPPAQFPDAPALQTWA